VDLSFELRLLLIYAVSVYRTLLFVYIIVTILQSLADVRVPDILRPALNFVYDVCEPFLRLCRRLVPQMRFGALDLSPMVGFLGLYLLEEVLKRVLF
jgi:uncharacterized protein YggT (Ycf19 family)